MAINEILGSETRFMGKSWLRNLVYGQQWQSISERKQCRCEFYKNSRAMASKFWKYCPARGSEFRNKTLQWL